MSPRESHDVKLDDKARTLDYEICRLLIERFDHAFELAKIKNALGEGIRDKRREDEVLDRVAEAECISFTRHCRRCVYMEIMAAARKMEEWAINASAPADHPAISRGELVKAKRQHREGIDILDSKIVRLLDRYLALVGSAGKETTYSNTEKTRQRICALTANSDLKQWIWQIFSCALGKPKTTVARAVSVGEEDGWGVCL